MKNKSPYLVTIVIAALLAAFVVGTHSTDRGHAGPVGVRYHASYAPKAVTFANGGDSVSTLSYLGKPRAQLSWVNWAKDARQPLQYVGGWAYSGKRTDEIAAGLTPTAAQVFVLMAGTNDVRQGRTFAQAAGYLPIIASKEAGAHLIVSLIPPSNGQPTQTTAYNAALSAYVLAHGWQLVDPWGAIRAADGTYLPGFTYDGTHPNGLGQRSSGAVLAAAIFAAGDGDLPTL